MTQIGKPLRIVRIVPVPIRLPEKSPPLPKEPQPAPPEREPVPTPARRLS